MAENTIGQAYIEIVPTTKGLGDKVSKALGGESNSAGALAGNAFSEAFGKAAGVTGAVTKAVADATSEFVGSAMEVGKSFDKAMSQVAATSGKTMDELNESIVSTESFTGNLTDFAQEMGRTTQFSATQAAEALNYMALAGYDAQKSADMLPTVLNLAAAGDMELARASDMVTDAQSALGLEMDETIDMVDMMAKTAASSNTSVEQLGEAFLTVGPTARDVAGGVQEMSAVLGTLANSGIKGTEAGTHLRNMMLAMNPTTDKAALAWEKLRMSAYDAEGELRPLNETFEEMAQKMSAMSTQERTQMLSDMFNKTDLSSINTMLSATIGNAEEVSEAFEAAGLSFDDFVDEDGFNSLSGAMSEAFFKLKEGTLQTEQDIAGFTEYLEEYGFSAEQAKTFMDAFLSTAKAGANDFDALNEKIGEFDGAAEQMAKTQLDNLAGDIDLYNSALEGLQIAAAGTLTPIVREFVQFGTDALSELTAKLKDSGVQEQMQQVADAIGESLDELIEVLPDLMDVAIELIKMLPDLLKMLIPILDMVVSKIGEMAEAFNAMSPEEQEQLIQGIAGAIAGFAALGTVVPVILNIAAGIANIITMVNGVIAAVPAIEGFIATLSGIGSAAAGFIMPALEGIAAVLTGPVLIAIGAVAAAIAVWIENWEYIKQIPEALAFLWGQLWTSIIDGVENAAEFVLNKFKGIVELIETIFNKLTGESSTWGTDMMQNLINGMKSKLKALKDTVRNIADSIAAYLHFSEPDVGPLSNFHTFMPDMMESMAAGIDQNAKLPVASIRNVSGEMAAAVQGEIATDAVNSTNSMNYEIASTDNSDLYNLMAQYLPEIAAGKNTTVKLEGDAAGIFNLVKNQNNMAKRMNGRSVLA